MTKKYVNLYGFIHTIGDIVILNGAYLIGYFFSFLSFENFSSSKYLQLWIYLNIIYLLAVNFSGSLEIYRNTRFSKIFNSLTRLIFFQVVLSFSYIVIFKDVYNTFKLSREVLLVTYAISSTLTIIWRFGFIKVVRFYRARGFNNREVIIVGAGDSGKEVKRMLQNKLEYGLTFLGFFEDDPEKYPEVKDHILGPVSEAIEFAYANDIDEIFCALPYEQDSKIKEIVTFAEENCIRMRIVPDFSRIINNQLAMVEIEHYGIVPILTIRQEPLENALNQIIKRIFDFGFTVLASIFILWWLIPLIALLIKLDDPKGPIFFVQERSGEMNKTFTVFKFRTMKVNTGAHSAQAVKGDSRITRIGAILRKTSMDELPQFINVLLGHMSVIGPRPHMLKHTEEYSKIVDKFMVRHLIKPGITGWAQVHGFRGETKDPKLMEERVKHDVWYIENWSFFLDIRILFLTVINLIKGEENAF
ncbi:MAG: undecaprenyl-phosphate glucose phosphotransferase [Bacteroidetes bacterium]|nr:undecaprenyl-phosphate glucose phosphotransferase [Bacteroidota bacterium]